MLKLTMTVADPLEVGKPQKESKPWLNNEWTCFLKAAVGLVKQCDNDNNRRR